MEEYLVTVRPTEAFCAFSESCPEPVAVQAGRNGFCGKTARGRI